MNKTERHKLILAAVEESGRVAIAELATAAAVSEMTIRRDLEALESAGGLLRVHGGAVTAASRSWEPGYASRELDSTPVKVQIGRAVADMISEGETVILDAGTTTLQVAHALVGRRNLRVMALSLRIAELLADEPGIDVMIPGGTIRKHERSIFGGLTERAFADLYFDTFVLSAGGIDAVAGVTEYNPDDAGAKRAAFRTSRRTILAADASKLDKVAFVRVCGLEELSAVVTSGPVPETTATQYLRSHAVDVVGAGPGSR